MTALTKRRARRPIALTITLAATALCVAACGSSSSSPSGTAAAAATPGAPTAASSAARTKFASCLKQHGVTLPNFRARRPGSGSAGAPPAGGQPGYGGGGGFFFGGGGGNGAGGSGGPGGRFSNPKFQAAFKACRSLLPAGAGRFQRRAALSHATVNKFVACVRQHGYDLPAPNFAGGPIFPAKIQTNAKFRTAAQSCVSLLRPTGAPPAAAGNGTGTSGA